MVVGLTGGIGSGKTTVAKLFSKFNDVAIYIADIEAKKLMSSSEIIKKKLIKQFGESSFVNQKLNRNYISEIVFNDKEKLSILNAIVHPEVKKHFQDFIKKNIDKTYIIYENAILFENGSNLLCDYIITVYANVNTKIERVILRDSSTKEAVESRMKNQWNDSKKIVQSNYIICNENLDETKTQVNKIHNILTEKRSSF
ncbi:MULTISPECIES: dephospho-CoA kinase [unclassified Polaribacter]|jgi:dephospho-CoA kinase|uniref:dephospho-CoA kinase n=1 Tax=unclassified Polaribacter TaxID=196858 RepID=UPI00052D1454|nr:MULTISPECIES: dephospho-CoA kinase [unclassified Polaribacter]KGL60665.1 dephospho-CoA kinase [Polaribacter sp. Hel1_33_49]MDG1194826.1 dephospho-CoA kinase [Polaribacter sp.]MDG1403125.1 dephospho-CoA kinase [Polaribacter sp.]PKV65041.1 dephospho-CoA kinase [Polaribacter sp. Hel1_33_96]